VKEEPMAVKPIPDGYHTVTPYFVVKGASDMIEFLKDAFGAVETFRIDGPNGTVGHAELRIGDSLIMLGDTSEQNVPTTTSIHLYVNDTDAVYQRALEVGATSLREPADQFYGDCSAGVKDGFGNQWWLATHIEDVSPEEMQRRAAKAMGSQ
jgi:PhnB protein